MSITLTHRRLPKALTSDELNALRAVPKNLRDHALIEVMSGCGLRVSEVCNLSLDDIHWFNETPSLRFTGKGSKERVVPMNLKVQDALRTWLEERDNLRFDTESAQIRWEMLRMDLLRSVVRSPVTGLVARVHVQPGDPTSPRTLLVQIIHPRDLKAHLFIPADRLSHIQVGQPVLARPAHAPDQVLRGQIISLSPVIEPESGTCRAVALFPGAGQRVRPGSVAYIHLDEPGVSHRQETMSSGSF